MLPPASIRTSAGRGRSGSKPFLPSRRESSLFRAAALPWPATSRERGLLGQGRLGLFPPPKELPTAFARFLESPQNCCTRSGLRSDEWRRLSPLDWSCDDQ